MQPAKACCLTSTLLSELMGVSKKTLTPTVVDAVIEKVAAKRVTNS